MITAREVDDALGLLFAIGYKRGDFSTRAIKVAVAANRAALAEPTSEWAESVSAQINELLHPEVTS